MPSRGVKYMFAQSSDEDQVSKYGRSGPSAVVLLHEAVDGEILLVCRRGDRCSSLVLRLSRKVWASTTEVQAGLH